MILDKNNPIVYDMLTQIDIQNVLDEYHSKKVEDDEKARKEFYDKFRSISDKYTLLQDTCKGIFIFLIAKSPCDR